MNTTATPSTDGRTEFHCDDIIVRVGAVPVRRRNDPKVIRQKDSLSSVVDRITQSGSRVLAWFSLRRAWIFDGGPESDARVLIVRDPVGSAWWFRLPSDTSHPKSTLPVSDINKARVWYPSFFCALNWCDDAREMDHGACIDLVTNQWDARLFPATPWPFDNIGVQSPMSWKGCTGEVICSDSKQLEETRRRLESIGLSLRGSDTFLAVTDPFGHEWYVRVDCDT